MYLRPGWLKTAGWHKDEGCNQRYKTQKKFNKKMFRAYIWNKIFPNTALFCFICSVPYPDPLVFWPSGYENICTNPDPASYPSIDKQKVNKNLYYYRQFFGFLITYVTEEKNRTRIRNPEVRIRVSRTVWKHNGLDYFYKKYNGTKLRLENSGNYFQFVANNLQSWTSKLREPQEIHFSTLCLFYPFSFLSIFLT